jgi:D-tyrosyl-tRNA(Tyr) deacylase
MKAVIQRVAYATVTVDTRIVSKIEKGLVVLIGISPDDTLTDIQWLSNKIANLRIFNDDQDIMNKSLIDIDANAIVVSQFTLMAKTKKGNRPSYIGAAGPDIAIPLYEQFIQEFEKLLQKKVGTGIFGAHMKIDLQNDGPVTIVIDSHNK